MNFKEVEKELKEYGIEFKKDKRHKGRYEYLAYPASTGCGCFYYEKGRYFIVKPDNFDRPRSFDTEEVSESDFIKKFLRYIINECDRSLDNHNYNNHKRFYTHDTLVGLRNIREKYRKDTDVNKG